MIDTYKALITKLLSLTITDITSADIAWDNAGFDPANKPAWLAAYYIPATIDTEAKDQTAISERGIFQITVNVTVNDGYNTKALTIAQDVLDGFASGIVCEYNGVKVQTLGATSATPINGGGWYQIPLSINYVRI